MYRNKCASQKIESKRKICVRMIQINCYIKCAEHQNIKSFQLQVEFTHEFTHKVQY